MSRKKLSSGTKPLTAVELELMTILWRLGEASVNEILQALPPERDLAYTSVSTMIRILEQKGVVRSRKEGRGHVYLPVLDKSSYEAISVQHLVETVFEGTPSALVRRLLEAEDLSEDDLSSIRSLLDRQGLKSTPGRKPR